jgi:hypothetical protein
LYHKFAMALDANRRAMGTKRHSYGRMPELGL